MFFVEPVVSGEVGGGGRGVRASEKLVRVSSLVVLVLSRQKKTESCDLPCPLKTPSERVREVKPHSTVLHSTGEEY